MVDRGFMDNLRDTANVNLLDGVLKTEAENKNEISEKYKKLFQDSPASAQFNDEDLAIITILTADSTKSSNLFLISILELLNLYRYPEVLFETPDWKIAERNCILDLQQAFFLALKARSAKTRHVTLAVLLEGLGKTQFLKDKLLIPESLMKKFEEMSGEEVVE